VEKEEEMHKETHQTDQMVDLEEGVLMSLLLEEVEIHLQ
jgi:hypothetical protein